MILLNALLACPLVGANPGDNIAHKVNRDGIPVDEWATATHATAACGAAVKLLELRWADLRTRGTGITRCKPCRKGAA